MYGGTCSCGADCIDEAIRNSEIRQRRFTLRYVKFYLTIR